jgi:hypothetical protein
MIIAVAFELFVRRRLILSGLFLAGAVIGAGVIGYHFFGLDIERSYLYLTPFYETVNTPLAKNSTKILNLCLYFFFPAVFLPALLWHTIIRPKRPVRNDRAALYGVLKSRIRTAVLVAVSLATVYFSFSGIRRDSCRTLYLTECQMWPQLLEHVRNLPREHYNIIDTQCANRAMYHTGRLAEDMFSYSQQPGSLFSLLNIINGIYGRVGSSVLIDLGYVNYAEKRVYESLEDIGEDPFLLQRLVLINLVKGQTQTARIFLNVLAKDLIYGKQAKELLHRLDADPQLTTDKGIQYLRSIMPTEGLIFSMQQEKEARETLLLNLLKRNKHNKMAFEYLMAEYLLANQLDKFVQNLWRLDDFDYPKIPRHYEEAILYYSELTGKKVDLRGRKMSLLSVNRFMEFINTINRFKPDKKAAYNALVKDFGGSYLFYNAFGVSGAGK